MTRLRITLDQAPVAQALLPVRPLLHAGVYNFPPPQPKKLSAIS